VIFLPVFCYLCDWDQTSNLFNFYVGSFVFFDGSYDKIEGEEII
jgi:hypothetical protein